MSRLQIAVVGGGTCDDRTRELAYEVGAGLAKEGAVVVCGGRTGAMEAAACGAADHGGRSVGILPGDSAAQSPPNASIEVVVFTGLGQARNAVVVQSSAAVIAIGGGWGTLSEIALARKAGIAVVLLESWTLELPPGVEEAGLHLASNARDAVRLAVELADQRRLG